MPHFSSYNPSKSKTVKRKATGPWSNIKAPSTFLAPAELTPGQYSLEVRSKLGQSSLRTGQYIKTLTVV